MHKSSNEVSLGLNQRQLAKHLSVNRTKIEEIVGDYELEPMHGLYLWHRVFRQIHGIERTALARHLSLLKLRYGTALSNIVDLETELRAPLLTFEEVALRLGKKPDTLAKAIRQGRDALPFPTLNLGPRIRRYRPLEVSLWIDQGIMLDFPTATPLPVKHQRSQEAAPAVSTSVLRKSANIEAFPQAASDPKDSKKINKNSLFGAFSQDKQKIVR